MARPAEDGFTLIEMLVTCLLIGILSSIGAYGFTAAQKGLAVRGTQRELVSALRGLQTRTVSEDTAYCMDFSASGGAAWTAYRMPDDVARSSYVMPGGFDCATTTGAVRVASYAAQKPAALAAPAFEQRNGATTKFVVFYPRGSASAGTVNITRDGQFAYTITIDGITARVSSTGR